MFKKLASSKSFFFIILLCIIGFITHLPWFNFSNLLYSGDWTYWPNEAIKGFYNSYATWVPFDNFGVVNVFPPFLFIGSIWSLITNLGFSFDSATKITLLIPIAILGFITPYILFKKLTKHDFISFIVALFYGTTTYFLLRQTELLSIAFVYAITPLTLYLFMRAFEESKLANWLYFVLIFSISIYYEVRITYVVTFILLIYGAFFHI